MNNQKINLEELQVESFITSLSPEEQAEQKGGTTGGCALASAISATVASATAVTAFSYQVGKDASWYFCGDEEEKKREECGCYE